MGSGASALYTYGLYYGARQFCRTGRVFVKVVWMGFQWNPPLERTRDFKRDMAGARKQTRQSRGALDGCYTDG